MSTNDSTFENYASTNGAAHDATSNNYATTNGASSNGTVGYNASDYGISDSGASDCCMASLMMAPPKINPLMMVPPMWCFQKRGF